MFRLFTGAYIALPILAAIGATSSLGFSAAQTDATGNAAEICCSSCDTDCGCCLDSPCVCETCESVDNRCIGATATCSSSAVTTCALNSEVCCIVDGKACCASGNETCCASGNNSAVNEGAELALADATCDCGVCDDGCGCCDDEDCECEGCECPACAG